LTAAQLAEWDAYLRIEPLDTSRNDFLMAELLAMTGNINRDTEAKPEPFTRLDFLPWIDRPPPPPKDVPKEDLNPELQAKRLRALLKGN